MFVQWLKAQLRPSRASSTEWLASRRASLVVVRLRQRG